MAKNKINYFNIFIEFLKMKKKKAYLLESYEVNEENYYKKLKDNFLEFAIETEFLKEKNIDDVTVVVNELLEIPEYKKSCSVSNFVKLSKELWYV